MSIIKQKLLLYWKLIKSLQTGLLLATGLAGYMSACCPVTNFLTLINVAGSLFLAIRGSTVLNMWYDRDIDAKMTRTFSRQPPIGVINPGDAACHGIVLSTACVFPASVLAPLYRLIVFAGLFFDLVF